MRRTVLAGILCALVLAAVGLAPATAKATPSFTPPGHAKCSTSALIRFEWMKGYDDPSTPDNLDRVGVLKIGSPSARNGSRVGQSCS